MSWGDAKMPLWCDKCGDEVLVEMHYGYHDYSGKNGEWMDPETLPDGWVEIDDDPDKHICEACTEDLVKA